MKINRRYKHGNGFEITFREVMISLLIIISMMTGGLFISNSIHDHITEDSERYFKSLKIDNDSNMFDYGIKTEIGDSLSYGKFTANEAVSDKLINGKYFSINKTEEHYTMHTRTVSYKCGKSTCHRTETYWTWDYYDEEDFNTKTFNFLNRNFKYSKIDFSNYHYNDTVKTSAHVRFVYYTIPYSFNGTLFSKLTNNTINDTKLYDDVTIKQLIDIKQHSADNWVLGFWIGWILVILIIVIIFVALDNEYINDK